MTKLTCFYKELYTFIRLGYRELALESFRTYSHSLPLTTTFNNYQALSLLNHQLYYSILIKEDIDMSNCCLQNDSLIFHHVFSNFIELGCQIITSYIDAYSLCKSASNTHIQHALQYIQNHLHHELNLEIVSHAISINKCYLCHLFKTELNISFASYILKERMELAKYLLQNTDNSIESISFKCGFNSTSYFCTRFKKLVGYTPSSFRKL